MVENGRLDSYFTQPAKRRMPLVFIVDDERDTCVILSALFEASGYKTAAFMSGEAVLEALETGPKPDLMILDLMMPGIDGLEVCSRARTKISSERMPIIVASALDDSSKRVEALELGADDYISKPFEPREVVKRAEIQLAIRRIWVESELGRRSYEVLFETIPMGVAQLGVGDDVPILNPVAREILGLGGNALTAAIVKEHLGFDPVKRLLGEDGPIAEDRKYKQGAFRVDCRAIEADGKLLGCLVIMRDVTRELELDELKTQFAEVVSHELRSPLTSINNAVNLIGGSEPLTDDIRAKLFGIIERNTKRMVTMVRDLLDLSKLQAGRQSLTLVDADLSKIARNVADSQRELASSRRVALELGFGEDFPSHLFIDVTAMERVLTNLVSNAIKYTNEGTTVRIFGTREGSAAWALADPRADLLNTFARGYIRVSVADEGMGVPPEENKRIFEKFVRIDRKVHGDAVGTGLGLPIAQTLVRAHGGDLWVESRPGQGAWFVFQIPIFDRYGALAVSIAERLSAAKRDRRSIGMIVLRMHSMDQEKALKEFSWDLAGDLAEVARGALFRATDHAVFNPHLGEVVVILEGCMQEILPQVAARVASEIRNHFKKNIKEVPVEITCGYAYAIPDSTMAEAMGLLESARAKAAFTQGARRRILIVDDDVLFATSTARILDMYRFEPILAKDAKSAISLMDEKRPDLVMLDISLPDFDGYNLAVEIRNRPELKHVPIFFISGMDRDTARARAFSAGGNEFFQKPVEASVLMEKVRLYVG